MESPTFNMVLKYSGKICPVVYDNSTGDYNNKSYCEKQNVLYYGDGENHGLSKAYNFVIDNIVTSPHDYLMILDDDTELTAAYFEEVFDRLEALPAILAPVVRAGEMILSPSNIVFGCKISMINSIRDLNSRNYTAINSGLIIKREVFDKLRYDEQLFLDCVDHDFFRQAALNGYELSVLQSEICQHYSKNEKTTPEQALSRFKIYKKDFGYFCRKWRKKWFFFPHMFKFALKESVKYKKIIWE